MPVVCTGNDFSTLYAPLIRDGRMEKFYWAPTREDRVGVAMGIFQVRTPAATGLRPSADAIRAPTVHCCALLSAIHIRPFISPAHRRRTIGQCCAA